MEEANNNVAMPGRALESNVASRSVFISYASADAVIAKRVCEVLEEHGISCWIAPRNVEAGADYGQAIIEGIKVSQVMLVLLSAESGVSRYVAREVERAVTHQVKLLPVRLAPLDIPAQLEFFLGSCQWFDLFPPAAAPQMDQLVGAVTRLLGVPSTKPSVGAKNKISVTPRPTKSIRLIAALAVLGLLAVSAGLVYKQLHKPTAPPADGPVVTNVTEHLPLALTAPANGAACLGSTHLEWEEDGLKSAELDGFEVELTLPGAKPSTHRIGIRYSYQIPQCSGEVAWRVRPLYKNGINGSWSEQRKFLHDQDVLSRILRTQELHLGHAESGNSFINGESASLSGFDVDLTKELVTRIIQRRNPNAKLALVPHATRWIRKDKDGKSELFLNLLKRDSSVDLLASGISITDERRREGLMFTSPVLTCPQTLITLKNVAGFTNGKPTFQRLGAVDGTTNMELALRFQKALPTLEVIKFSGSGAHEKMLKALCETREIDAALADKPLALKKIKNFQGEGSDTEFNTEDVKEIAGEIITAEQIAFVIRPGDIAFMEELNREIKDTIEFRRDLVKKYFPTLDPITEVP